MKLIVNAMLRLVGLEMSRAGATESSRSLLARVTRDGVDIYRAAVLPDLPQQGAVGTELVYELTGTEFGEALYVLDALQRSANVDGDCCEFGVAKGVTSALIPHAIRPR